MNKLRLLFTAATMLSLVAGTAYAGRIMGMQGDPETSTGVGMAKTLSGFEEVGSPYTGAQGLEGESAAPFSVPAPGTINMRINSFVNEFPMAMWWTGMNGAGTGTPNKQQPYGVYGWIRVDIGIDGETKSGIEYGAFTEIRENNTTSIGGGTAPAAASGFAQSASGDSGDNTLYVRHAFVYIGTKEAGFVRMGSVVNAMTLYEMGLSDDMDLGGWISFGSGGAAAPAQATPIWPWADNGGAYMAAGIAYVSPVIDGFDAGISFEPNNSTPLDGNGCTEYAGCATQSSSVNTGDLKSRYRNMLNIALRYRNTFGPVGLALSGIWTTSGRVNNATGLAANNYDNLDLGDVGTEVSINHSLSLEGNVMWGSINNNWQLKPEGGANAVAWTAGIKYTFLAAPVTIGTYYFNYKYQGIPNTFGSQQVSQGVDGAVVYGLGPGVALLAEAAWGQVHQSGFNLLTSTASGAYNTVDAKVITAGMSVRF